MTKTPLLKAAMLTVILVSVTVISWESYVRKIGLTTSFDDDPALWADKRSQVYEPADKATVFIGSSRIKYDLDIPTWESLTGDHAIQLACVGSNPVPVLENLAADPKFTGKLVIDVTEGLFFSTAPQNLDQPNTKIKYYQSETPAQKASFQVNHLLESQLAFLDKESFSLNAYLTEIPLANRPGVFAMPVFPWQFERNSFERQAYMTDRFAADTVQRNIVIHIWDFFRRMSTEPPASGLKLDSMFNNVITCVNKIRERGGQVIFIRTPSSGGLRQGELMAFPREKYWDKLLAYTNTKGIHFNDDSVTTLMQCPEFSHLKKSDAILYTKHLYEHIKNDIGWKFPKTQL